MKTVYIEAILTDNNECIHYGKSLGYVSKRQAELVENGACKITKGNEPIVSVSKKCEAA